MNDACVVMDRRLHTCTHIQRPPSVRDDFGFGYHLVHERIYVCECIKVFIQCMQISTTGPLSRAHEQQRRSSRGYTGRAVGCGFAPGERLRLAPRPPHLILNLNLYLPFHPYRALSGVCPSKTRAKANPSRIPQGCDDYRKRIHCLLYPNCNHHVAHCLNRMNYAG